MSASQIACAIVGIIAGLSGAFYQRYVSLATRERKQREELDKAHAEAKQANDAIDRVNSMSDDDVNKRLHNDWRGK